MNVPDLVITTGTTAPECVAVPGTAVVVVALLLAGPATIRAWRRPYDGG